MPYYNECPLCGAHLDPGESCDCEDKPEQVKGQSPYERERAAVYATGNRWAVENFNATH